MNILRGLILSLILFATGVHADKKNITVTLPFPAGGATDRVWRVLDSKLTEQLKSHDIKLQTEYRVGAGGGIAGTHVATTPVGETRLLFTSASLMIAPSSNDNINYKPNDFTMLGYFGSLPMMVVVPANGPKNIKELQQLCRTRPIMYGSAGVGSTVHLVSEEFLKSINCSATHVPYKGAPAAMPDLVSARLDFVVDWVSSSTMSLIEQNRLNVVLIIGQNRLKQFPQVPTAGQAGLKLEALNNWQVFVANSTADTKEIEILRRAVQKVMRDPDNLKLFTDLGLEGAGNTVDENFLFDNYQYYQKIIKKYNLK
jgi:hypothetical protein